MGFNGDLMVIYGDLMVIYGDIIPKNLGLVLVEYGLTWFNRDYSGET